MTMKRAIIALAAMLLGACNAATRISAEEAANAVQAAVGAQITPPVTSAGAVKGAPVSSAVADSVAGDPSQFRRDTRALAIVFNGTVAWSLGLVSLVTHFPPTSCSTDTCTWGPWSDALATVEWRLTVTKVEDRHFDYAFAGHLKAPSPPVACAATAASPSTATRPRPSAPPPPTPASSPPPGRTRAG
jgi:hypothetical protein